MFSVRYLRVRAKPGRVGGLRTILDQSIHVARYADLLPADPRVQLGTFSDVEDAITLVANRYQHLAHTQPELAQNLSPATPDEIRRWHRADELRSIRVDASIVGLLAIAAGSIGWMIGDEINEEVISTTHNGQGYAASAQAAWASTASNPEQFLCGTIDRHNHSSRRTATKAGRKRVLDDTFVAIAHRACPPIGGYRNHLI